MSFVFVSYSRQDLNYVSQLVQALEAKGLPFWLDERIEHSATWPHVIEQHVNECQVFLLVMTPRSFESHWVQCELTRAIELKKPIFPLLLEGIRWFSVTALQVRDVTNGELPPNNFFTDIERHFPKAPTTSQTFSIPDAADWQLPESSSLVDLDNKSEFPKIPDSSKVGRVIKQMDILNASIDRTTTNFFQQLFEADDLASKKKIDYTRLRDLLKAGKWQEADQETCQRMLEAIGRKNGNWFYNKDEFLSFPCTDLKTIDHLWVRYSNNQFGFSVQKEIYDQCFTKSRGNFPGDVERIWEEFCDQVGWRVHTSYTSYILYPNTVTFSISAPRGHLPANGFGIEGEVFSGRSMELRDGLFSRLQACEA